MNNTERASKKVLSGNLRIFVVDDTNSIRNFHVSVEAAGKWDQNHIRFIIIGFRFVKLRENIPVDMDRVLDFEYIENVNRKISAAFQLTRAVHQP